MTSAAEQAGPVQVGEPVELAAIRLRTALAGPRQGIEEAFLAVGARLGEASALLDPIVAAFEALPRDLSGSEMADAIARLGDFVDHTRAIANAFSSERQDIARLVTAVGAAYAPIDDLRRSVRLMGILAVNARIVAAGISDAVDQFDVFTTDIAELADVASKAITDFYEGHQQLSTAVTRAAGEFTAFETAHRDVLIGLADELGTGLADIEETRRASAERSAETARISREVSMRVAHAVMALQVGDSTRQRVEHVEGALDLLAGWLKEAPSLALSRAVLALEQAQLADAIRTFNSDTTSAHEALASLAADAGPAIADCLRLYGGKGGKGGTSLAALGDQTRRAAALLRDCEEERSRLGAMAERVARTVEVLVGHVEAVRDIEANMRLVSLNAAVKCAQLGPRGAALSVIAGQLRELTGDLVLAARMATERLADATSAASVFTAASTGRLAEQLGELERQASASVGQLADVDARLAHALATLERDGPAATARLTEAARGLGGHGAIAEALSDVQFEIAGLLERLPGSEVLAGEERLVAAYAQLRRAYSMEEERAVHDRCAGPLAPAPAEPSAGEDDILLF